MRISFWPGAILVLFAAMAAAQSPPFMATFPSRPKADAATLARGKELYKVNCAYCHGEDARGGENGGTNLLREDVVMKDQKGELLRAFLANPGEGRHLSAREGQQKFNFTEAQAADIAAFIHDFRLSSRDPGRMRPPTILVGDAKAGAQYFQAKCAACHSVTGDLQGIGTRIKDPRSLQQTWLMPVIYGPRFGERPEAPRRIPPPTVTVTLANGQKLEGRLGRIDDFIVTMTLADGTPRTIHRDGEVPKVEVHDPMKPHKDLLPVYTDRDIHNVTAYLASIK